MSEKIRANKMEHDVRLISPRPQMHILKAAEGRQFLFSYGVLVAALRNDTLVVADEYAPVTVMGQHLEAGREKRSNHTSAHIGHFARLVDAKHVTTWPPGCMMELLLP